MKTLTFIAGIALMGLFSFNLAHDAKKSTAEVNQYQGVYVFTDSKPVMETEYLGTVSTSVMGMCNQYECLRGKAVEKAKKEYPNAEAIIMSFDKDKGNAKCDVLKFK